MVRRFELRRRLRREPRLGGAECAAALDREVGTLSRGRALGGHAKRSIGAEVLVAGVLQTSDPRRPGALPNLSLSVSEALRATRAE